MERFPSASRTRIVNPVFVKESEPDEARPTSAPPKMGSSVLKFPPPKSTSASPAGRLLNGWNVCRTLSLVPFRGRVRSVQPDRSSAEPEPLTSSTNSSSAPLRVPSWFASPAGPSGGSARNSLMTSVRGTTRSRASAVKSPTVALIVVCPAASPTALTLLMVATFVSLEAKETTAFSISSPSESKGLAPKRISPPTGIVAVAGVISIRVGRGGAPPSVIVSVALLLSMPSARTTSGTVPAPFKRDGSATCS